MKRSIKGDAPESFLQWKQEERDAGIEPAYASLQNPQKRDVVSALLSEQCHLCAYCGRRLETDPGNCHIDHFWPQAYFDGRANQDRRLDYDNFFMSCGPQSLPGAHAKSLPDTCGNAKNDWFDVQFHVIPSDPDCEFRFVYSGAGKISPKDGNDRAAWNMIENLQLNDPSLVNERKKLILIVERDIVRSADLGDALDQLYESWRMPDTRGRLQGFAQVAYRYIEEEQDPADLRRATPSIPLPR